MIQDLNTNFALNEDENVILFKIGEGGIPIVEIKNKLASAQISLQGAHLLSWVPSGEEDVLWLSDDAVFSEGKSIRGGIPICWPWFGAHESNENFPSHGFARTVLWNVMKTSALPSGGTQIEFQLDTENLSAESKMWPHATLVNYCLTIGSVLKLELKTINKSDKDIVIGQALHTYFNISDISDTTVNGLDNCDYLDKTDNFSRKTQTGPVIINTEVDRVYLNTWDDVIIDNKQRCIVIKKEGSQSTVVWNPWERLATNMGDFNDDGYQKMLCVETANAMDDTVCIPASDSHTLTAIYELSNIPDEDSSVS